MKVKSSVTYTQLSYIESTGTQFIDTGFVPNNNTRVVIDFEIISQPINVYYTIFASRSNTYSDAFCVFSQNNTGTPNTTLDSYGTNRDITLQHSLIGRHVIDKNKNVVILDGEIIYQHDNPTFNSVCELRLLADNKPDGGDGHYCVGKLYSCKIYDNGILIRDYIPVVDNKNIICLLDKVSETFFYNSGIGNFIAGNITGTNITDTWVDEKECYIKVSNSYTPISYIESTGTQWIDTEFIANSSTRVVCDFQYPYTENSWGGLFTSRTSTPYTKEFALWRSASGTFRSNFDNDTGVMFSANIDPIGRHTVDHNMNVVTLDSETISHEYVDFVCSRSLMLFVGASGGIMEYPSSARIYSCQIYNFSNAAKNLIVENVFLNGGSITVSTQYDGKHSSTKIPYTTGNKIYTRINVSSTNGKVNAGARYWDSSGTYVGQKLVDPINGIASTVYSHSSATQMDFSVQSIVNNKNTLTFSNCVWVDLTETFGEGNEPTKEWCDANIPFFSSVIGINQTLIRDYIPVLDHNNTPCLFDKVSNKFFYNQGTGNFIAGETIGNKITSDGWTKAKSVFAKVSDNYTPVDYIESTGTQWIDTGFFAPEGCSISCEMSFVKCDSPTTIIGACDSNGAAQYLVGFPYEYNTYTHVWNMSIGSIANVGFYNGHTTDMVVNRRYNIDASFVPNDVTIRINNIVYANGVTGINDDGIRPNKSLYLFATHYDNTVNYYSYIRIYKFKIYDQNNVLVRNFIPVKDKNGVVCLYDKVHGQFYYNQGTGDFIAAETSHVEVEYLESTGTQYVDTQISDANGFKTEMTIMYTDYYTNGYMACIGCHESASPWKANFIRIYDSSQWNLGAVDMPMYTSTTGVTNQQYFIEGSTLVGNSYLIVDGSPILSSSNTEERSLNNVLLFGLNTGSSPAQCSKMKLYSCKIYNNNNILIRDYIPVRDKNNIACLYDKVEGKYYYNQGTGEFFAPTKSYTELEYIESTGTQFINTGVTTTNDTVIDARMLVVDTNSTDRVLFGTTYTSWAWYDILCFMNPVGTLEMGAYNTPATKAVSVNTVYDIHFETSLLKCTINGESLTNNGSTVTTNGNTITIFKGNGKSGLSRCYGFKIKKNNILVRDYIPVLDSSGVACLYDKVHNRYYYDENNYGFIGGKIAGCNVWKQVI